MFLYGICLFSVLVCRSDDLRFGLEGLRISGKSDAVVSGLHHLVVLLVLIVSFVQEFSASLGGRMKSLQSAEWH